MPLDMGGGGGGAAYPAPSQVTKEDNTQNNVSSGQMLGLGITYAPTKSTQLLVMLTGTLYQTVAANGCIMYLCYGTGTPPANGAAITGTKVAAQKILGVQYSPATLASIIKGLTVGTTYWFDVGFILGGGAGNLDNSSDASVSLNVSILEC